MSPHAAPVINASAAQSDFQIWYSFGPYLLRRYIQPRSKYQYFGQLLQCEEKTPGSGRLDAKEILNQRYSTMATTEKVYNHLRL